MTSQDASRLLEPESGVQPAPLVSRFKDWGDRICCGVLIAVAFVFLVAIGWYVWQMPAFR